MQRTYDVLGEVAEERQHQIEQHNWTPDHDDRHNLAGWAWLICRRAVDLSHPWPTTVGINGRRLLVEIAAIAVAAIESIDRQQRTEETPR